MIGEQSRENAVDYGLRCLGDAHFKLSQINKDIEEGKDLLVVGLKLKDLEFWLDSYQRIMLEKMEGKQ